MPFINYTELLAEIDIAMFNEARGREITVLDRLGLHPEPVPERVGNAQSRSPNKFRRQLAYWLFNPDPTIDGARAVARHEKVIAAVCGASLILSSSPPPESAHVGAWLLSQKTGVTYIVDLRDGWLDESLKPILNSLGLRRWLEGHIEAHILRDAKTIHVTSEVWLNLLVKRLSALKPKTCVLMNGYPKSLHDPLPNLPKVTHDLVLIHAGRFTESRLTQMPGLLLDTLFEDLSQKPARGVIRLIGALSADELNLIESFKLRFADIGWSIECPGSMPGEELLQLLLNVDGLLLLSASYAVMPSKLFEYIPTGSPIFLVTHKDSAAWRIGVELPQASVVEVSGDLKMSVRHFFSERVSAEISLEKMPLEFTEVELKGVFPGSIAMNVDEESIFKKKM